MYVSQPASLLLPAICIVSLACGQASSSAPPSTSQQSTAAQQSANSVQSTPDSQQIIAYTRGGTEIRLIDPDGGNDRRLWTHPDATFDLGLFEIAWRPDGNELAFSSGHAAATSLYHADIYCIKPDGSGFRRVTNAPDKSAYANYPKGSVTVTLRNFQYSFQQAQSSSGVFTVYVTGADKPQQITLPPGKSTTVTFPSVADLGKDVQPIVAIWGKYRWFMPGTDVQAGKNIKAPDFTISGDGIGMFGAFHPRWRNDGSLLSFRNGHCIISTIPANPPPGVHFFQPLFAGESPMGTCSWDWGPTPALADQLIYTENEGEQSCIYRMKEGGKHPGTKLTAYSDISYQILHDLHWLPDGSGLLYSTINLMRDASNIFRYDFNTRQTTQVTSLENEFARNFSISPDGKWIVYERCKAEDDYKEVDLWLIGIDGTGSKLLVKNGLCPSWSK